jgi:hypothetical protein
LAIAKIKQNQRLIRTLNEALGLGGIMRIGTVLLFVVLFVLLGASAWFAYDGLTVGDDTAMSGHAYIAMGLGIFFSVLIGGGLMILLFYSSRYGYDEPAKLLDEEKKLPDETK